MKHLQSSFIKKRNKNDTKKQSGLTLNIKEVQKKAKQSLEAGAVTKDYSLNLEDTCKILNDALAIEILCVLRYRHHEIIAKDIDRIQVAQEFAKHAASEEEHMMMLAERICQLGSNPDFNPTITTRCPLLT